MSVADTGAQTTIEQTVFYVDQLDVNISTPVHDVGTVPIGTTKNSTSEIVITVKTV